MKSRGTCLFIILLSMIILSGCASMKGSGAKDVPVMAQRSSEQNGAPGELFRQARPDEGSLWVDQGVRLFTDMRARNVGDVITVRISESPSGKLNASTKTSRNSSIEAGITDVLGYLKALEAKNSGFDRTSMFKAAYSPRFEGKGDISRNGEVTAYVAARVVEVFPNGNLYIKGQREIKVNNETQYITLSGVVRPEDISPANEISSTYIAEARIEYSGKGVIAERQRPGWLARILDYVWPF